MDIQLRSRLQPGDFDFIKSLTTDQRVYQHIRNGKSWNDHKINTFIEKCIHQQELLPKERNIFMYVIEKLNLPEEIDKIGIIGISRRGRKFSLTIFIHPSFQGKGYFSRSLELLKERLRICKPRLTHIFAQTHIKNLKMLSILSSKFEYVREYNIGEIPVKEFLIPL